MPGAARLHEIPWLGVVLTGAAAPICAHLFSHGRSPRMAGASDRGHRRCWQRRHDPSKSSRHAWLGTPLYEGPGPEVEATWTRVLEIANPLDDTKQRLAALWGLLTKKLNNYQLCPVSALFSD
jgi:hypothetical protein